MAFIIFVPILRLSGILAQFATEAQALKHYSKLQTFLNMQLQDLIQSSCTVVPIFFNISNYAVLTKCALSLVQLQNVQ